MKTINLEARLGQGKTRSDFLGIMPVLREYILKQAVELPQKEAQHTIRRLLETCPAISDSDERCCAIVGCIDTEKHPFRTFWVLADATLEGFGALSEVRQEQKMPPDYHALGTVAIVACAVQTYVTGVKIYNAARYAYTKPVEQNRLGAYWEKVKI